MIKVFISYAREDFQFAERLYYDLKKLGIRPWIDQLDILPGQNWKFVISKAIQESRYFIALLSSNSISKKGYFQRELAIAVDILDEFSPEDIFFIPVRLDDCKPNHEKIKFLHWADLFPSYDDGIKKILRVLLPKEKSETDNKYNVKADNIQGVIQADRFEKIEQNVKCGEILKNHYGMEFVYVPSGSFIMGSPEDEPGRYDDEIQHNVTLSKGFYIQTSTVTHSQWKTIMGNNPSYFIKNDQLPVEQVSWNDVQIFIKRINQIEGVKKYRLPTESEWEYACRAGTITPYSWGQHCDCSKANYGNSSISAECSANPGETMPVASFSPNTWGLHDMHGNLWEFCSDWYGEYPNANIVDPYGPSSGSFKIVRGGSWAVDSFNIRSAMRMKVDVNSRNSYVGFRIIRKAA